MRRREFIAGLAGTIASTAPFTTRAQQPERVRRVGVLMNLAADDPLGQARNDLFQESLRKLGWTIGQNVQIDTRWAAGDPDRFRQYAAELVALAPDVIVATTGPTVQALQQVTRTIPIVFAQATDPVGAGLVQSLARPGGNTTGFTQHEFGLSGKLVEVLREIAPRVKRVAVLQDARFAAGVGQLGALQGAAQSIGMELLPLNIGGGGGIESAVAAFARGPSDGLIVPPSTIASMQRDLIIRLAAQRRLPAIYPFRYYVVGGGLIAYGPDLDDQYRRTAIYVDRVLKGEKPSDLAVQAATKFDLAINLRTAKALGLDVPPTLLARADEVIE